MSDRLTVREDFLDFPTAWAIQEAGDGEHDHDCSAGSTGGAFLCDCTVVARTYVELVRRQMSSRGEPVAAITKKVDELQQKYLRESGAP